MIGDKQESISILGVGGIANQARLFGRFIYLFGGFPSRKRKKRKKEKRKKGKKKKGKGKMEKRIYFMKIIYSSVNIIKSECLYFQSFSSFVATYTCNTLIQLAIHTILRTEGSYIDIFDGWFLILIKELGKDKRDIFFSFSKDRRGWSSAFKINTWMTSVDLHIYSIQLFRPKI